MTRRHTYDFGIIGNGSFLGYIDKTANVVWQCWPDFDSNFIFGSLLDRQKGGEFSIQPSEANVTSKQYYLENTNVLATEFHCSTGSFRVIDFAPCFEYEQQMVFPRQLLRKVELLSGNPRITVKCRPAINEGGELGIAVPNEYTNIAYEGLSYQLQLATNFSIASIIDETPFELTENGYLALCCDSTIEMPLEETVEVVLSQTLAYWHKWVGQMRLPVFAKKEVIRSALILKLHQFTETGAIIASGTTSLPEHPGSERNWDYRYCWMRDAYFALSALCSLNHFFEMKSYLEYMKKVIFHSDKVIQPLYTIKGEADIPERIADLAGYLGNKPVRFGNAAYTQIQNDVYAQVIMSILPLLVSGKLDKDVGAYIGIVKSFLERIDAVMDQPDAGLWEYRERQQVHIGTLLFHWAGIDAAMQIADHLNDLDLQKQAEILLSKVKILIEQGYNKELKGYTAASTNSHFNASEFLLVTMNYLKNDPVKAKEHVYAMERALKSKNDFIFRYRDNDDFGETHSSFMICCFWYVEALADIGRIEDAKKIFSKLVSTANHLGILSEDVDPSDESQWGNFAQTYSHAGLIRAAWKLENNK